MDVHPTGDTSPAIPGIEQSPLTVDVSVEVVRPTLVGIVREVEYRDGSRLPEMSLPARKYLPFINLPYAVIRELFGIVFYVRGRKPRVPVGEHTIDMEPGKLCPVFTIFGVVGKSCFGE
ncbi:hypothetical protein SDC9_199463 [bioreactor metagenome]|uniref:Uncharacterized protein n=1 Tax=bioreactor metagenome TaxID=1076179 RepID=A0A645ITU8_9ZZZZ